MFRFSIYVYTFTLSWQRDFSEKIVNTCVLVSFCVCSTDHFYFPRFEHLTDGSNPRAFVSAFVQPTDADVDSLDSFMDEPVGILTSMIGAPCFIYLMVRRRYGFGGAKE